MKKIFGITSLVVSIAFFVVFCGCSENYKRYKEVKEKMSYGTDDARNEMDIYYKDIPGKLRELRSKIDSMTMLPSIPQSSDYYFVGYTYYEWAADLFDEFGDYKNSKKLAKKARYLAAVYFYEKNGAVKKDVIKRGSMDAYLNRAYRLMLKAGEYKDAPDKAIAYSAIMLKNTLDLVVKNGYYGRISVLFRSLDEKSKEINAHLIYQLVEPNFAAESWSYKSRVRDFSYLQMIKEYLPVSDTIREKMYRAAMDILNSDGFWKEKTYFELQANIFDYFGDYKDSRQWLTANIFDYLGDYKDSKQWPTRIKEANNFPILSEEKYAAKAGQTGREKQARTIVIVLSHDGIEDESSIKSNIEMSLGKRLKEETKGNIFFTYEPAKACVVIHYERTHTFYRTFQYTGGVTADYYHTKTTMEIKAANGNVLWSKTMNNNIRTPFSTIGGGAKYRNICAPAPVYHTEVLEILQKYFAEIENK
ncbi:MAG: hypothetical protein LBL90_05930 [Prevotellaceae bacterium]|jgi:hypothetical protein|nr:hypothetical protein [Prevotellaceae bacterium]